MTISYDPQEYTKGFGFLRILFSWKTTVLPSVFKSGLFWLNFCLHISFQLFARWGPINQMNMASSRNGGDGEDIGAAAAGADAVDVGSDVRRRLAGGGVDADVPGQIQELVQVTPRGTPPWDPFHGPPSMGAPSSSSSCR